MPYRLSVNEDKGYIRFDLTGELTKPDIGGAIRDLMITMEKHGFANVLCDERELEVPPSDMVGFSTAEKLTSKEFAHMKLAIIRAGGTKERLFEIAAANRGAKVRVFTDEEEAVGWLGER